MQIIDNRQGETTHSSRMTTTSGQQRSVGGVGIAVPAGPRVSVASSHDSPPPRYSWMPNVAGDPSAQRISVIKDDLAGFVFTDSPGVTESENHDEGKDQVDNEDDDDDKEIEDDSVDDSEEGGELSSGSDTSTTPPDSNMPQILQARYARLDRPFTEPTIPLDHEYDEPISYDLKAPLPTNSKNSNEAIAERFFSIDHLNAILCDHALAARLTTFLTDHHQRHAETLKQYMKMRKALVAVQYANAMMRGLRPALNTSSMKAASIDERFAEKMDELVASLVEEILPLFLTHRLVALVTDNLVREITGNTTPIMRDMIPALAEVFCISDPSLRDTPIIYASEEFFNTTQYGRDYVIGRNCRFLQGPRTSKSAIKRMSTALKHGHEFCETVLNYRRDGSPFMNLLMVAPLYDNKGRVRYFLGCQIDVSLLIEDGRGMESFARMLMQTQTRSESRFGERGRETSQLLSEFAQMMSDDELDVIRENSRKTSTGRLSRSSSRARLLLGMEPDAATTVVDGLASTMPSLSAPSGRLPGVYRNVRVSVSNPATHHQQQQRLTNRSQYLLVRPYPSLRVTFTSPSMRIPGLLQSKLLSRIGGSGAVYDGLVDAFKHGVSVTARVSWLSGGHATPKPRWIHCTPLLGSDQRVGVWMIVIVDQEDSSSTSSSGLGRSTSSATSKRSVTSDVSETSTSTLLGSRQRFPATPTMTATSRGYNHSSASVANGDVHGNGKNSIDADREMMRPGTAASSYTLSLGSGARRSQDRLREY